MLFMFFFFQNFPRKVLGDMVALYTDRRTDVHTRREEQYMSPAGGDI